MNRALSKHLHKHIDVKTCSTTLKKKKTKTKNTEYRKSKQTALEFELRKVNKAGNKLHKNKNTAEDM